MKINIHKSEFWKDKANVHQFVIVCFSILLAVILKNRYDYRDYERQWQFFINGGNPWDYGSNAYGPLHNLMAFLHLANAKLPRLIFTLSAFIASLFLYQK
ncbi:MAG: hypothetical protein HC896_13005 [Bacteroidales bacterium]|nr:hypothetical protein [Bacteroidales bacterium]